MKSNFSSTQDRLEAFIKENEHLGIKILLHSLGFQTLLEALKYHERLEDYEMCMRIKDVIDHEIAMIDKKSDLW